MKTTARSDLIIKHFRGPNASEDDWDALNAFLNSSDFYSIYGFDALRKAILGTKTIPRSK